MVGTFAISHPQTRRPTTHDFQLLETASFLASIAIKRMDDLGNLQDSEARFRDLYESAPLAYFTSDMDGHIKSVNQCGVQLLGYSQEQLMNRSIIDLYAPTKNGREKAQRLYIQTKKGKEVDGEELEMQRINGSHVWVSLTVRLIRDDEGNPSERRAIVEDITDRKRAEELMGHQKSILEMISTKSPLPDVLTKICKSVENQSEHMYCSVHLLEGNVLRNGAAPNLQETYIRKLDGIAIGPCAGSCGTAAYRKEPVIVSDIATDPLWERGRRLALRHGLQACWSTPILSSSGSVLGTFAMYYPAPRVPDSDSFKLIDIATSLAGIAIEQQQAENALQKSEDRYRTLYDDNPTMYFTVSTEGTVLSVNKFGAHQLGHTPEDLIGKPVVSIFHEDDQPTVLSEFERSLRDPTKLSSWEFRKVRNDGSLMWVKETTRVIENPNGGPVVLIVCEDITNRKRTEQLQTLQQSTLELMVAGATQSDILNALCSQVEVMVPSAICSILTLDSKDQCLRFQAGPSVPPPLAAALDGMIPGPCAGSCGTATFKREPVYVSNTATDPLWAHLQDAAKQFNIGACWSFPIYAEGKHILGSFAISSPHPHSPSSLEVQILETVSYLAGIAIRRIETEHALTESEHRYRTLYEDNPSMYFTVSSDGTVLSVNEFGANQLGYTVQELLGKPASMLFVEEDQVPVKNKLAECLKNPKDLAHWEFRKIRKDRRIICVRETVRVVRNKDNEEVFLIVCDDITERKIIEDSLRAIAEAASTLTGVEFFRFLVKNLATCLNMKYAFLTECTDLSKQKLRTMAFWSGTTFVENIEYQIADTPCEEVIKGEISHYQQSVQQHFPLDQDLKTLEVESYVGHPLFTQAGEIFGHLVVMDTKPLSENSPAVPIIKLFAARAAAELERNKADSQLREAYKQTRELSARLEAAEEAERKRIARELHDEFGQMLTGLKFDLSWVQRRLSEQPTLTPYHSLLTKTRSMSKLTDELIQTVRRIATSLRPSILDDLGLIPALEWQAKDFQKRTGIQCRFTTSSEINNVSFDSDRATALFRISQELCTNVLRYAQASELNVDLSEENHVAVLAVQDNGRGISDQEIRHPTSLGLLGIKERVAPFKGKFLIKGKSGKGTRATVYIPLP